VSTLTLCSPLLSVTQATFVCEKKVSSGLNTGIAGSSLARDTEDVRLFLCGYGLIPHPRSQTICLHRDLESLYSGRGPAAAINVNTLLQSTRGLQYERQQSVGKSMLSRQSEGVNETLILFTKQTHNVGPRYLLLNALKRFPLILVGVCGRG
jgi:hypothetical protein